MKIDWQFISNLEGAAITIGYVPMAKNSNSGVTIGTGVDLGQMSAAQIKALPLLPYLIDKLLPYAGLTKDAAVICLRMAPLTLSWDEVAALDVAVMTKHGQEISDRYTVTGTRFDSLPAEAQTVIASVAYQYGDLPRKCPRFWKSVTAQDWKAAVHELRNFGDDYETRRNIEADLLERIL